MRELRDRYGGSENQDREKTDSLRENENRSPKVRKREREIENEGREKSQS